MSAAPGAWALLVAFITPSLAQAQRPGAGVLLPGATHAAEDHAEAAEVNPGGLGFGGAFDLTLTTVDAAGDRAGEGFATHVALGLLDPWHTALGFQFLEVAGRQRNEPLKVTWANALALSETAALGLSWHTFYADDDRALDRLSTIDVGLALRPWRYLALGIVATDAATPSFGGVPLDRGWEFSLALRPGTERLTLGGSARVPESGPEAETFGARLQAALFGGFGLEGRWDTQDLAAGRSHQLVVGLTHQFAAPLGLGLFGFSPDVADDGAAWGLASRVRVSAAQEAGAERPRRTPRVLELVVRGDVDELASGGLFDFSPRTPFLNLIERLRHVETDPGVDAVLLALVDPGYGWAQAEELRRRIQAVRRAGKTVYAWTAVGDTRGYYVACAADKVYTAPAGGLLVTGLRAEFTYLKPLLDKVGAQPEFVAVGAYKSAPEMFTREGPSEPAREAENALLDDIFTRLVDGIAESRGQKPEAVRTWIDDAPYDAQRARAVGLVDGVIQYDEFEGEFEKHFGRRPHFVRTEDLRTRNADRWGRRPAIGVLYAVGTITDGESVNNPFTGSVSTGADTFLQAARALREDKDVEAVVLRIDSPGGSVTASDAMWRELSLLARDKPLIVSMGDVAASGGYYVAVPGAEIFAEGSTVTGSIGVFTGKFDLSGLYEWLGVRNETFVRGARADLLSLSRPWTADEVTAVRAGMEALYTLFLDRVVASRPRLPRAQLEQVAQGRVWTGAAARTHGLVDHQGGLSEAIARAAEVIGRDRDDVALEVAPSGGGLGGIPRSPVLSELLAAVGQGQARTLAAAVPEPLRRLLDLPLAHFRSGEPLALLPFVLED